MRQESPDPPEVGVNFGRVGVVRCELRAGQRRTALTSGGSALNRLSLVLAVEMLRHGPRQSRVTVTDPRLTSSAVASADLGSSSSDRRGLRLPANDDTASVLSRPVPSIRQ